jgi:Family of unknown function (DUF6518)
MVVGGSFGIAARLVDDVAPKWVGNVGAVWFLAGFVVGRRARRWPAGAVLAALGLATANTSYYLWRYLVDQDASMRYLGHAGIYWLVMATGCGLVAGAVGALSTPRPALWGVVAGVCAGEALAVALLREKPAQVAIESLVALVCLGPAVRGRARDVAIAASAGIASVILLGLSYRAALGR